MRISTTTAVTTPEIHIASTVIDNSKARYSTYPPTQCTNNADIKTCVNNIWIAKTTDTIGLRFSWQKNKDFKINNIKYEIAKNSVLDFGNEERYKAILSKMAQIYFRSNDVNWKNIALVGQQALTAPSSIDPLPGAIAEVIARLPENEETFIFNKPIPIKNTHINNSTDGKTSPQPDYLPTCEAINTSTWRLNLPGTYIESGNNWFAVKEVEYVEAAHKCLTKTGVSKWIVNLTKLNAGSYLDALAALAPLLGNGPVLITKSASNETKLLINNLNIGEGDTTFISWQNQFPPYKGQIDFVLSEHCGDEICSNVWLAVKDHGRTIGFQSNSIFSSNTHIDINKTMHLQITYAITVGANGKTYTKVDPLAVVDKKNIEKALNDQLQ